MESLNTVWPGAAPELRDCDVKAISRLVYEKCGITLHDGKRALIEARLYKRVRQGGFRSFAQYVKHVENDASGDEITALLDAIATNHTSFFREGAHFTFLRDVVLPPLLRRAGGPVRGWSAACSTGEEPYTIGMTCLNALGDTPGDRVRLLASDLSTKALKTARAGVYKADRVRGIPTDVLRQYFEKGLGEQEGLVRVAPTVRRLVDFRQLNLLELPPTGEPFDFIFCRNVMIYFDAQIQQRVVDGLVQRLAPGGYLFISHSESLNRVSHHLTWVAPAIYRRSAQ